MKELVLYTSNREKAQQAERELPTITAKKPSFNENKIKEAINRNSLKHPLEYPLEISKKKFCSLRENEEIIRVVSDSVAAVIDGERWLVINRDEDENNLNEAEEIAKRTGIIYFIGAVTFGVDQPYSILSYCKVNLRDNCNLSLPLEIDSLPQIVDPKKGFEVGYFDTNFNERLICNTFNFDSPNKDQGKRARPFISGLTREVLEIAEWLGNFEVNVAGILKELISQYPFNNLSFYALTHGFDKDQIRLFYSSLFNTDFFEKYGGNCSLFSHHLGKKLEELGYRVYVVIFPSETPYHKSGHSGVLVELTEELHVLLDLGLSIPYLLPLSEFPLHYFVDYGNSKNAKLRFDEEGNLILVISSPQKGEIVFPAKEKISLEEFTRKIPKILSELHNRRELVKIDFHDKNGSQLLRIAFDLNRKTTIINNDQSFDNPDAVMEYFERERITLPSHLMENIISLFNY